MASLWLTATWKGKHRHSESPALGFIAQHNILRHCGTEYRFGQFRSAAPVHPLPLSSPHLAYLLQGQGVGGVGGVV